MIINRITSEKINEIKRLYVKNQPYTFNIIEKERLEDYSHLNIVAYLFSWPDTIGSGGDVDIITQEGSLFRINYHCGDIAYCDLLKVVPDLESDIDDIHPWKSYGTCINGWYWYEIRSLCWLRIHESIWDAFSILAEKYHDYLDPYWICLVLESISKSDLLPVSLEDSKSRSFKETVMKLISNGAVEYDGLKIINIQFEPENNHDNHLAKIILDSPIPGIISKDRGLTWQKGYTKKNLFFVTGVI